MEAGRPRNLKSPNDLFKLWDFYKDWVANNPEVEEVVTVKGDIVEKKTTKPLTRQGFISFVYEKEGFIVKDYLDGLYKEFSEVATYIRNQWEESQISGTMTGKYKAQTLVARLNGYTDKQEATVNLNQINADFGTKS